MHFTVDLFQNTYPTIYVNDLLLFYIEIQNVVRKDITMKMISEV